MKFQYYIFIALIGLFAACNNSEEDNIIPHDEFVNLLVDLHIFEVVISDYSLSTQITNVDSLSLYTSIFDNYNTDKSIFEASLLWYSSRPKEIATIYDEVFGILSKRDVKLAETIKLFSLNGADVVWEKTKYGIYRGDTTKYPEPFVIPIDTIGNYLFDIRVRMLKEDASENPFLIAYFYKDEIDTIPEDRIDVIRTPIQKSNFARDYDYYYMLKDSTYKFIKIIIPETPSRGKGLNKDMNISTVRIMRREEDISEIIEKTKK